MSGGNALAVTFSLVAGVASTVQIAVMGRLGDRVGVVPALFGLDRIAVGCPWLVGWRCSPRERRWFSGARS